MDRGEKWGSSSSQHPLPSLRHVSMWQVPVAAGRVAALYCNKVNVLVWFNAAELGQQEALQPQAAFTNKWFTFRVRRVLTNEVKQRKRENSHTTWKSAFSLCLANAVLILPRSSLQDLTRQMWESRATKRDVYESSIAQANPSENIYIYEIYYRLKQNR